MTYVRAADNKRQAEITTAGYEKTQAEYVVCRACVGRLPITDGRDAENRCNNPDRAT